MAGMFFLFVLCPWQEGWCYIYFFEYNDTDKYNVNMKKIESIIISGINLHADKNIKII